MFDISELLAEASDMLNEEAGISSWVSRFDKKIPLLEGYRIQPLMPDARMVHYQELQFLAKTHAPATIDALLSCLRDIPRFDISLEALSEQTLLLAEAYILYTAVRNIKRLRTLSPASLPDAPWVDVVNELMDGYFLADGALNLGPDHQKDLHTLQSSKNREKQVIRDWEACIAKTLGLTMIWPLGLEIDKEISNTDLESLYLRMRPLRLQRRYVLEFMDHPLLTQIHQSTLALENQMELRSQEKLDKLSSVLKPFQQAFSDCFHNLRNLAYRLSLISRQNDTEQCIPESKEHLALSSAYLPAMKSNPDLVPLSLAMKHQTLVLFGSNMSGKTTVLKTLFVLAKLTRFGLPLPAVSASFPSFCDVHLHLKTSGSLNAGTSSFIHELRFYLHAKPGDLYLADEIFQSTEPLGGAILAKTLVEDFRDNNLMAVFSTHYPEPLYVENIDCVRMHHNFQPQALHGETVEALMQKQRQDTLNLILLESSASSSLSARIRGLLSDLQGP